jgi:hypothetical protein
MVPSRGRPWEEGPDGRVRVLLPRYGDGVLGRWLERRIGKPDVVLNLDELGSVAWKAIDGRRTVGQIAALLQQRFGEAVEPADERLGRFLWILASRRHVRWDGPTEF